MYHFCADIELLASISAVAIIISTMQALLFEHKVQFHVKIMVEKMAYVL